MASSTGPILAAGAITWANLAILNDTPLSPIAVPVPTSPTSDPATMRIIIATAIAAGGLRLWESFMPRTATAVSWVALLSVLLVRVDPRYPSPLENLSAWYNKGSRR